MTQWSKGRATDIDTGSPESRVWRPAGTLTFVSRFPWVADSMRPWRHGNGNIFESSGAKLAIGTVAA